MLFWLWGMAVGMSIIALQVVGTGEVRGSNWKVTREGDPKRFRFNVYLYVVPTALLYAAAIALTVYRNFSN